MTHLHFLRGISLFEKGTYEALALICRVLVFRKTFMTVKYIIDIFTQLGPFFSVLCSHIKNSCSGCKRISEYLVIYQIKVGTIHTVSTGALKHEMGVQHRVVLALGKLWR